MLESADPADAPDWKISAVRNTQDSFIVSILISYGVDICTDTIITNYKVSWLDYLFYRQRKGRMELTEKGCHVLV